MLSTETAWWQEQLGLCVAVGPNIWGSSQGLMVEAVEVKDKQCVFWSGDAHSAGMLCPALGVL